MSQIVLNARFDNLANLKQACREYAVTNYFETRTRYATSKRYELCCKAEGCPWRLYARAIEKSSSFIISVLHDEHTCFGINHTGNSAATSDYVANFIHEKLKQQPEYRAINIVKDIKRELGVEVKYHKAFRAKEIATLKVNGTYEETYSKLPKYCQELEAANPGSIIDISKTDKSNKFHRLFLCYHASAVGFQFCRFLLGIDGTHLKSKYQGILLIATAIDARGSLFPFAFGVVDIENDDNWLWFLFHLRNVLQMHIGPEILDTSNAFTFLSDRQKGLIEAVEQVFPQSAHGYCLKHLEANFHKVYKHPELKPLLWKAAGAITEAEFEKALEEMRNINADAVTWLLSHAEPKHWAEVYFKGHRYGHLTSNIAESLNSWLLKARELPLLPMLELIRDQLMEWFAERRNNGAKLTGILVPEVSKAMQTLMARARRYRSIPSTDCIYAVKSLITAADYVINLEEETCSCRAWQSQGYPCAHAINVILTKRQDPQKFTKPFFLVNAYRQIYSGSIFPPAASIDLGKTPDFEETALGIAWLAGNDSGNDAESDRNEQQENEDVGDSDTMLPPNTRRPAGRPKKRRIRSEVNEESGQTRAFKCSRCKGLGHSRRTCRVAI